MYYDTRIWVVLFRSYEEGGALLYRFSQYLDKLKNVNVNPSKKFVEVVITILLLLCLLGLWVYESVLVLVFHHLPAEQLYFQNFWHSASPIPRRSVERDQIL